MILLVRTVAAVACWLVVQAAPASASHPELFIVDASGVEDEVWHYDSWRLVIETLENSDFNDARGIAFSPDGTLWVLDERPDTANDVWSYDFATRTFIGLADSDFVDPRALAFAADGTLWVLESNDGELDDLWLYDFATQSWDTLAESNFVDPRALAFAADGTLWILDSDSGTNADLWSLDFTTEILEDLPGTDFVDPRALAFAADGKLWILDSDSGTNPDLWSLDFPAEILEDLPGTEFIDPRALAFAADGKLWILDSDPGAYPDLWSLDLVADVLEDLPGSDFVDPRGIAFGAIPVHVPLIGGWAAAALVALLLLVLRARTRTIAILVAALLAGAGPARAKPDTASEVVEAEQSVDEAESAPEPSSRLSVAYGFDAFAQLAGHGAILRYDHVVPEPWAEIGLAVYRNDTGRLLDDVHLTLGWWRQDHEEWTSTDYRHSQAWYEADVYAGLTFGLLGSSQVDLRYARPDTPADAYDDLSEVSFTLSHDDGGWWPSGWTDAGFLGLQPWVSLSRSTYDTTQGSQRGRYVEVGMEPTLAPFAGTRLHRLSVSLPTRLARSDDGLAERGIELGTRPYDYELSETGLILTYSFSEYFDVYAGALLFYVRADSDEVDSGDGAEVTGAFGASIHF